MGIEEPTLVGLLRRLESDGWITRRDASHDRRCKNVRLARKSSRVLHEIFDTARQLRHELIATVPERDLQTCMRVLTKIRERAEATDVQLKNGRGRRKEKMSVAELKMATREAGRKSRASLWSQARSLWLAGLSLVLFVLLVFAPVHLEPKKRRLPRHDQSSRKSGRRKMCRVISMKLAPAPLTKRCRCKRKSAARSWSDIFRTAPM